MIENLYEAVGMKVRNFIIDYHDKKKQSYYKPIQIVIMDPVTEEDIVANIIEEQKAQGNDVYGVVEVYGKYTLSELKDLAEGLEASKYNIRPLFFDKVKGAYVKALPNAANIKEEPCNTSTNLLSRLHQYYIKGVAPVQE